MSLHSPRPEPLLAALVLRSDHPGRCLTFYQLLGLEFEPAPERERPNFFHARIAGARLEIRPASASRPASPSPGLGFCFPSVEALANALLAEGFRVCPAPPGSSPGAQALALDPDGRPVELFPIDPEGACCPPSPPSDAFGAELSTESEELSETAREEAREILERAAQTSQPEQTPSPEKGSHRSRAPKKTRATSRSVV